ncbi:MAG TPA: transcription elongation factor GreA [Solirubrobacterales bacterium]|nr:transcription elongation factor GreA [Solirubrobacterales bacterium]
MSKDVHVTPEGLAGIKRELDELVKVRRPDIADKIRSARQLGDLSENFEYHAAKNEQGFIEARIAELEAIVRNAVLIETPAATGKVSVGSTVTFEEEGGGAPETYKIVGPAEADFTAGRISFESDLGKSLLGHKVGDEVQVITPNGGGYMVRITALE